MSVGHICAVARSKGHSVKVVSPLATGAGSFKRTMRPHIFGRYEAILRHQSAITRSKFVRDARQKISRHWSPASEHAHLATLSEIENVLRGGIDLLLISAYTMYRGLCTLICAKAQEFGVPVLVGGPMFSVPEVTDDWLTMPGLSAIFVGEPEIQMESILQASLNGGTSVTGLATPKTGRNGIAQPLANLDQLPFPDYSDFPWDLYPNRIIPMMTGRGCGWGVCTFCSDVFTTAGREHRSRTPDNVLEEMAEQHRRHDTSTFTFLDLKLNSDLAVWDGLISEAQSVVPGCEWTASLHVNINASNGLSAAELKSARSAGLSRVTTGLESGSQGMLNRMARGTRVEALSEFVRHAWEAGISVRMTSIIGYPGETAEDVTLTNRFLHNHLKYVDRIIVNRLAISPLTPIGKSVLRNPSRYKAIRNVSLDVENGLLKHENATFQEKGHSRAVRRLLRTVHEINRKPLKGASLTFEGVM